MKTQTLFIGFILMAITAKAQDDVVQIQVTDDLRKKFTAEARQPDPSQIVYDTPPELLKKTLGTPQLPDASQIVYDTPPALLKKTILFPQQPDPAQIPDTSPASAEPKKAKKK